MPRLSYFYDPRHCPTHRRARGRTRRAPLPLSRPRRSHHLRPRIRPPPRRAASPRRGPPRTQAARFPHPARRRRTHQRLPHRAPCAAHAQPRQQLLAPRRGRFRPAGAPEPARRSSRIRLRAKNRRRGPQPHLPRQPTRARRHPWRRSPRRRNHRQRPHHPHHSPPAAAAGGQLRNPRRGLHGKQRLRPAQRPSARPTTSRSSPTRATPRPARSSCKTPT